MNSLNQLIALLKTINHEFDEDRVSISQPTAIERDNDGNNTSIVLKAKAGSGYIGNKTLRYKRLDLEKVFAGVSPSLDAETITTNSITGLVNETYGTDFYADDFTLERAEKTVKLIAKPENYKYTGQITIPVALRLESVLHSNPNGFQYEPLSLMTKDGYDYSQSIQGITSNYLRGLNSSMNMNTELVARLLKAITNDDWVSTEKPANYNLMNARVTDTNYIQENGSFVQTVDIQLDDSKSKRVKGKISLRFPAIIKHPLTHYTNYDSRASEIQTIPVGEVDEALATKINGIIKAKTLQVDTYWRVVYNGPIASVPSDYLNDISQSKTNICLIVNQSDNNAERIVLSYN